MEKPLVSVIIPTYNRAYILHKAIDSVLNETYRNLELIIVDDRSTDNTDILVHGYMEKDGRVKYFRNSRGKGPAGARNCGILNSKGKYIAFLDSDDQWMKNHLEDAESVLENENIDVCFALWMETCAGKCSKVDDGEWFKNKLSEAIDTLKPKVKGNLIFWGENFFEFTLLTYFYCYHINTMVFNKKILDEIGLFSEKLPMEEDNQFLFRTLSRFPFCLIKDYHFIYNQGNDNLYAFMDRGNVDADNIIKDEKVIEKLTVQGKCKVVALKSRMKLVKNSSKLVSKDKCMDILKSEISEKYLTIGYINRERKKWVSACFYLKSLRYRLDKHVPLLLLRLAFPNAFSQAKLDIRFHWR